VPPEKRGQYLERIAAMLAMRRPFSDEPAMKKLRATVFRSVTQS
jgi:hypothetical protein